MSLVKSVARRVARGVSRQVARHELFEKPGERAVTDPLPESETDGSGDAPSEADVVEASASSDAEEDEPPSARLVGVRDLSAALKPRGRPMVVHHWATWCEPCAEELPRIEALAKALGDDADVVGLSWELFDSPEPPQQALGTVSAYAAGLGLSWPTLVFEGAPESLFSALELDFQQIPQTRVIASDGSCLEEIQRPLEDSDVARLSAMVRA